MTIEFNCPKCNEVIAFPEKHAGKNAHCISCGQRFVIPSKSFDKAEKLNPPEEIPVPVDGFYHAVFIDNWKLFIKPQNATGLVFVTAVVCFKFFTGHLDYSWELNGFRFQAPVGLIVTMCSWGCLFWYYMEMICSMTIDYEEMPDVGMGGFFGFIWNVIKSLYIFTMVFFAVEIPGIISIALFGSQNIISILLSMIGFALFPIAILTISVISDITNIIKLNNILKPVIKAFWPYFTVAVMFIVTCQLQLMTIGYGRLTGAGNFIIGLNLLANLGVQMLAIITMRSIGLFYRHYGCYFKW